MVLSTDTWIPLNVGKLSHKIGMSTLHCFKTKIFEFFGKNKAQSPKSRQFCANRDPDNDLRWEHTTSKLYRSFFLLNSAAASEEERDPTFSPLLPGEVTKNHPYTFTSHCVAILCDP